MEQDNMNMIWLKKGNIIVCGVVGSCGKLSIECVWCMVF